MSRRTDPVEICDVRALRFAGKTLVISVAGGPAILIPVSEIHARSEVQKPGDAGKLLLPAWLAIDRELVDEDDV